MKKLKLFLLLLPLLPLLAVLSCRKESDLGQTSFSYVVKAQRDLKTRSNGFCYTETFQGGKGLNGEPFECAGDLTLDWIKLYNGTVLNYGIEVLTDKEPNLTNEIAFCQAVQADLDALGFCSVVGLKAEWVPVTWFDPPNITGWMSRFFLCVTYNDDGGPYMESMQFSVDYNCPEPSLHYVSSEDFVYIQDHECELDYYDYYATCEIQENPCSYIPEEGNFYESSGDTLRSMSGWFVDVYLDQVLLSNGQTSENDIWFMQDGMVHPQASTLFAEGSGDPVCEHYPNLDFDSRATVQFAQGTLYLYLHLCIGEVPYSVITEYTVKVRSSHSFPTFTSYTIQVAEYPQCLSAGYSAQIIGCSN